MAVLSTMAGMLGYVLTTTGVVVVSPYLAARVPPEKHAALLADGYAHGAAYLTGFLGGIFVLVRTWIRRGLLARQIQDKRHANG